MKKIDYDRVKDAVAYLFLLRSTLEGGGCFVLYAERSADGSVHCYKAAMSYLDKMPRPAGDEPSVIETVLFDEPIPCNPFRRDLDFLVERGLLDGNPEKIDYCTFNRKDLIALRTFDGRNGIYRIEPVSWQDPRYRLVLDILRKYDPGNQFEEMTTH